MILNVVLLVLVFGAVKKKSSPYIAALILAIVKGGVAFLITRKISAGFSEGLIFGAVAAAFVYFMKRLDRREDAEREDIPTYSLAASEKVKFKWEYIPLAILLVLMIIG